MESCVHRTWKPQFSAKVNSHFFWQIERNNSRMEKVLKPEIERLPYNMVPDLVYKFEIICFC